MEDGRCREDRRQRDQQVPGPHADAWSLNRPFVSSLSLWLLAKNPIASMIRKNRTENITIAANASQPDGSSDSTTGVAAVAYACVDI